MHCEFCCITPHYLWLSDQVGFKNAGKFSTLTDIAVIILWHVLKLTLDVFCLHTHARLNKLNWFYFLSHQGKKAAWLIYQSVLNFFFNMGKASPTSLLILGLHQINEKLFFCSYTETHGHPLFVSWLYDANKSGKPYPKISSFNQIGWKLESTRLEVKLCLQGIELMQYSLLREN